MIRIRALLLAATMSVAGSGAGLSAPAMAAGEPALMGAASIAAINGDAAARYRDIFTAMDGQRWGDAKNSILTLDADDSMRPYLLAKLYTAKGSPRVDLFDLLDLLNKAPYLPQAEQIGRLASKRGAEILPDRPQIKQLMWTGGAPQRKILGAVKDDAMADSLRGQIVERIVANDPAGAEALLMPLDVNLTAEGRTEMRYRIAWSYYICGNTREARRMATSAIQSGTGNFLAPAHWALGLAAWREQDWNGAAGAFYNAASNASDGDMRSGGYFWAARATMADRHPERVNALLKAAAREEESFYGLMARETLGLSPSASLRREPVSAQDWAALKASPNARNAVILTTLRRANEADSVLKHEAQISNDSQYGALVHLASDLSLPTTQLWLALRSPNGRKPATYARFPTPSWAPANGWQVDKSLVYAHALQESRFQTDARSLADARGVMQVVPGTGRELASKAGMSFTPEQLYDPSVNLALGQLYLKKLADMPATQGLLPKVVAAYNAGPTPIERWNVDVRDGGDPLLFIESVPYYETRAYLNAVLRNYFVYQMEDQGQSPALAAMAQGLWTRFPDGKKAVAIRVAPSERAFGAN